VKDFKDKVAVITGAASGIAEPQALFVQAFSHVWLERGMDPKEVGWQMLDAIREERFYVITHDS
jgi:NADP-dependent 3-hydroxy acid dehydrogenase YdfG